MLDTRLEAFYGLPETVCFCKKCVISNQRPSSTVEFTHAKQDKKEVIGFDEDGVCSACRYNEIKEATIDWKNREDQLVAVLDKHRSPGGAYDVVVPGSGGKDSAYTAHVLKYRYGMNPLTVTWSPHRYTDIGRQNFDNWIDVGGMDNLLFTPNGKLHRLLTKLAFHNLLHPFQPFIVGQRIIGPSIATKFGIKLVMYGENQAEYGNNPNENYTPVMDKKFFSCTDAKRMVLGGCTVADIMKEHGYTLNDFAPYIPPLAQDLEDKGIEVHYMGYYHQWDPQECYYYAVENTGFSANTERTEGSYSKYSSIDDKIDPFHYFTTLIKFGIGRATYDAAQEIRNGKISREEGAYLVRKFDQEFPKKYFKEFLEYIDTSEDKFWQIINKHRSPHLWKQLAGGEWKLRHTVFE